MARGCRPHVLRKALECREILGGPGTEIVTPSHRMELVMALEEAFDVEIPDEDADKFLTIGDVADYIAQKSNKPREPEQSLLRKIWNIIQQVLGRVNK